MAREWQSRRANMPDFIETIPLAKLPVGKAIVVRVAGVEVALFNVDGTIYSTSDACAHAGSSLGSSKLRGNVVTCRAHGFRYDVTTGNCLNISGLRVRSFATKVVDGKILVAVG